MGNFLTDRLIGMTRVLLLAGLATVCGWSATQEEALRRIAELEARLARAEALIEKLLSEKELPAIEVARATPAPVAAPEVVASQTPPAREGMPQELLPTLGQIGASASFLAGGQSGAYGTRRGTYFGGSVNLPLRKLPGGLLLYEFSAGLNRSLGDLTVTSNVAQVANLAVLGPGGLNDALTGTGAAPFPVRFATVSAVDVLQVVPFGFKYQARALERWRLRPYVNAGLGLYVTISNQQTQLGVRREANLPAELRSAVEGLFGNGAPFNGALIGGQITAANEVAGRGLPSGQGGLNPGVQLGGGLEWRAAPRLSIGVDFRWNRLSNGVGFVTLAPRTSFHF